LDGRGGSIVARLQLGFMILTASGEKHRDEYDKNVPHGNLL
jgi:hypothetical protein